jgi:hypothetical protein
LFKRAKIDTKSWYRCVFSAIAVSRPVMPQARCRVMA